MNQRDEGPTFEECAANFQRRHGKTPREMQAQAARETGYGPIWLRLEGSQILVEVEVGGKWYIVIREHKDGNFSHCVEPAGIQSVVREGEFDPVLTLSPEPTQPSTRP